MHLLVCERNLCHQESYKHITRTRPSNIIGKLKNSWRKQDRTCHGFADVRAQTLLRDPDMTEKRAVFISNFERYEEFLEIGKGKVGSQVELCIPWIKEY